MKRPDAASKPIAIVCGEPADLVTELADGLDNVPGWSTLEYIGVTAPEFTRARLVVLARLASAATPPWLDRSASSLHLVVVGDPPPTELAPVCWFRAPPTVDTWVAMLTALFPASEPAEVDPPSWRRKGDMLIGSSPGIRDVLSALDRIASSMAPVLVTGESGTGKEIVARSLHFGGPRRHGPFIAINCAAIPEHLFESELFGHRRGAFTGADTDRAGAFESAHEGTLFLDEIGELEPSMQAKLLRVIQTSEVTPLGTSKPRPFDVRLVAASNRDLAVEMREGRFREDLYYRLHVFSIALPPLRDRKDDIPALVHHHLRLLAQREKRPMPRLNRAALDATMRHDWPGNVRELVSALERAFLCAHDGVIEAGHLALDAGAAEIELGRYREAKRDFERRYFGQAMRLAGGNISEAARLAGKTRKEVYEALRRTGLRVADYRVVPPPQKRA